MGTGSHNYGYLKIENQHRLMSMVKDHHKYTVVACTLYFSQIEVTVSAYLSSDPSSILVESLKSTPTLVSQS